jgi:ligand-binding sensor domain-containing protein/signal transduction histidine kinase
MQSCNRIKKSAWLWLLLLLMLVRVSAEQLPLKLYTTADGLAHEHVLQIVRDTRGFLWLCTLDGLSRFDGTRFVNYGVKEGLPHANINDLVESRHGYYWVATSAGLSRFTPASSARTSGKLFTTYQVGQSETSNRIFTLFEDRAGVLWIGTTAGVFRLAAGKADLQRVALQVPGHADETIEVQKIVGDAEGSVWVGTNFGLVRLLPDGRSQHYIVRPGEGMDMIWTLLCDAQGRVWIGHYGSGLLIFKPEPAARSSAKQLSLAQTALTHNLVAGRLLLPEKPGEARWYGAEDGLSDPTIRAFHLASTGRIWLGTRSGPLTVFDGTRFINYTQGFTRRVTALAEDSAGNLWAGARSGGVLRISRWGFLTFRTEDGLAMNDVNAIYADRHGTLTVISNGWYINQYDGEGFTSVRLNLPAAIAQSSVGNREMVQDRAGDWWISTGAGVVRFPAVAQLSDLASARPIVYTKRDGLADDNVNRIFADSRGDIWAASYHPPETLVRWERATGRWQRFGEADGIPPNNWPNRITEDRAGNVWIAMHYGGALRYRQGRLEYFGVEAGLPNEVMQGIRVDRSGRLWLGSKGLGAMRCDDPAAEKPRFTLFTVAQGLASNIVWNFTEDQWGRIYIAHARGADRVELATGRVKHFTAADGLSRGEVTAAFADKQGALWFGTREGLSKLIPTEHDEAPPPPPVVISRVDVAGRTQEIPEFGQSVVPGLRLEPDQNQIEFEFFGLNFALGAPLRYQYKFEGFDRDWSAPSEQRTVAANLAPGSYRFLVRAVNADGQVSATPGAVSFIILPPFWQRWWFILLAAAALGGLAYLGHRSRVARVVAVERVRTRIATDLHDDIGASLSRVAILSEVVKHQAGQDNGHNTQSAALLTEIADSARGLVDSMSDIVWSIDPRRDDLQQVVARARQFAADVFEAQGVQWEFSVPPEVEKAIEKIKLDPDERRHLYLIFKEAINNAAKYAGCQKFSLALAVRQQQLIAEISDDGCGFVWQPASVQPVLLSKTRGGNGLQNMQARAVELGGKLQIETAPGRGTRLYLTMPVK